MTEYLGLAPRPAWHAEITRHQWLVLVSTALAWALDGFAGSLYVLVIGPTMTELLPHSGIAADEASIGLYGGITIMVYLVGWATGGIFFGILSDYAGRVQVLSIGVATYAVFTAVGAFAETWWQLGVLRFIAGIGSGVEAPVGAALVTEAWRNRYRARACGVMMSGYATGFLVAALVYALLGEYGWRVLFASAIVPALLVWLIRRHVHEPEELNAAKAARRHRKALGAPTAEDRFVLARLLTPPMRRRTLMCTLVATGSLISFWSISTWTPEIVRNLAAADGLTGDAVDDRVSITSILLYTGGIVGYASWGFIADWLGRKVAFAISFATAAVSVAVLYPLPHSYLVYLVMLPVVGFGLCGAVGGSFVYFPEVFQPSMRATGIALTNSVGRYLTAASPLVAGVVSTTWFGGNLGIAATVLACSGVIGLIGVAYLPETRRPVPPGERPAYAAGTPRPAPPPDATADE